MIIELSSAQVDEIQVKVFKALADPVRLAIIRYLKKVNKEVTCGEVGEAIKMSKSAGSYHFRLLREAGLTKTRKSSREKYVSLNAENFDLYVTNFYKNL
ncbi:MULTISPECIES: ArsR/SmtB family transcription factor [Lacticaseibacillus]|jgi:DNA-binding transcriptional ArsR family regulator|uniref:Metalloregulator ArsR/SmtB family transcription factor n=8 Tax=Lacticaseibacillus TaxID=2759736 RepID=A0AAN1EZP2_LACCA|nr:MULTISPECIES: metalloregulator ArsR/SmtB family transcription factor [Lacticaseibacillus]OFR91477.1 transcriptional regulator [Lactobacillus sp. HMSC068F07]ARY92083.1 transcriptional regulator [Lacticaseibacillus casei]KAB1971133.1 helix-turn-helix transcriptional regulator [Lacticaseibacillus casei]KLI76007.1 transcriptional regulator [Lacticaseibacillus casei]KRK12033.1 transcription regulator [Lacticaseibacillus zeae DSM 20178 = KCTC 3804]